MPHLNKFDKNAKSFVLAASFLISIAGLIFVIAGLHNTPVLLVGIGLALISMAISIFVPMVGKRPKTPKQ